MMRSPESSATLCVLYDVEMRVIEGSVPDPVIVEGRVKWYDTMRGYGFIVAENWDQDILAHANCVRASGRSTLPEGARVKIEAARFERGWQAVSILDVEQMPVELHERPTDFVHDAPRDVPFLPARVKWFDRAKGFGFVNAFGSTRDVFVHMEVLRRSGMPDLQSGEAVAVRVVPGPRGLMASEIRLWEEAPQADAHLPELFQVDLPVSRPKVDAMPVIETVRRRDSA
jgi:CspA family cold shock protein